MVLIEMAVMSIEKCKYYWEMEKELRMDYRPEAIETKCAGCGAVIIWPDDGSLPVCSFPCDRALFEEAVAAKEWPLSIISEDSHTCAVGRG